MERIDSCFAAIWRPVLRFLCGMTGWSNFRWARAFLVPGWALVAVGFVDTTIVGRSLIWVPIALSALCLSGNLAMFHEIEQLSDVATEVAIVPPVVRELTPRRARLGLAALLLAIPIDHVSFLRLGIGALLVHASMYFVTDFQPRKPSWFTIAGRKLVTGLSKIHWRLPSPLPRPA